MQVKNATESDIYAQDIKKTGPFVNSPEFLGLSNRYSNSFDLHLYGFIQC